MTLQVVSLFSGVGGFDLGFEQAGMTVVARAENDPKAGMVLEKRWPGVQLYRDVHDVTADDWAGVDVVCGGFPCQDISVAGKQKGINRGDKSVLWWEFYRVLHDLRPRWVVIENVANLLGINQGRDMGAILGSLDELGYLGEWRVLDSQGFGVPQRRRRVFIVGRLGGLGGRTVLLDEEGGTGGAAAIGQEPNPSAASVADSPGQCHQVVLAFHRTQDPISGTVVPTLGATSGGQAVMVDGRVRRLTPIECERLQGFPDNWTVGVPEGHRYRFMGNAVTVNVARWIGERIVRCENKLSG